MTHQPPAPARALPQRLLATLLALAVTACSSSGPATRPAEPQATGSAVPPAPTAAPAADKRSRAEAGVLSREAQPTPPVAAAPLSTPYLPHPVQDVGRDSAYLGVTTRGATPHPVKRVAVEPVSTFSIDVDTGSYSSVRSLLRRGLAVPRDAVRVEEMLNYFSYDYPRPDARSGLPFAVHSELATTPWNPRTRLLKIGIQAADPAKETLPPANLVFLVDVSGSMNIPQSLPLVKQGLLAFVDQLRARDRVSIVTYSGSTRVLLESVPGDRKEEIRRAIESLRAGGSTAGASGLRLAYEQARNGYIEGGINRILLATDGDFNVGVTNIDQLKEIVAAERRSGIGLSTLGVGHASYNDALMEQIADVGDGKYSFLDTVAEARKVLVDEFTSTLATVASDVKLQVEFNPAVVKEYRLIGYDNRQLAREDFNNDRVDAGDVGAGHRVTALYEITLAGERGLHDEERYAANRPAGPVAGAGGADELGFLKLRYKRPGETESRLMEHVLARRARAFDRVDSDFGFAMAVAGFGQLLQGSPHLQGYGWPDVLQLAERHRGRDRDGQRSEFIELARRAARQGHSE
ncbi:VWA domain-containing protein [Aquabacterium sp. A7-Y]|uniref:vWA domain-containing protein n=1 Tax=Aquabacterium sp. A7-Y TaxID=1349605 RepID=UPI00223CFA43|nr:VWA domain-containing protein [Aquabacterium sp. A7-Y]MCW7536430.1 VWA domain-containing protein [Aquabacterium sp. A7-Y]